MINYEQLKKELCKYGMDEKRAAAFARRLHDDENAFHVGEKEKRWALERGFLPGRIELYGLNEDNYKDYLPEYNYFKIHPINHHFKIWINDKLTLKYVLNNELLADTMPEYYIYVENDGTYTYLMDYPEDVEKDGNVLIELLKKKKTLAMKPNSGTSCGRGFIKLELMETGEIFENNKPVNSERIKEIQKSLKNYIITEYIHQNQKLADVWPDSECTLRVVMCKNASDDPYAPATWSCPVAYARFGTSVSGGASNVNAGGVAVSFDYENGKLSSTGVQQVKYNADGEWKLNAHPDSGIKWAGMILPDWENVKKRIQQICDYISSLSYLGIDIIITDSGMKLCEINSMPLLGYEQVICGPVLAKEEVRDFFTAKGLFEQDSKELYQAYVNSQIQ